MIDSYYDTLAPYYKYIYPDWERSVEHQAKALDEVIREYFGDQTSTVLDAACGIGTQSIGLAKLGYKVTGYDLSSGAIQIAKQEARSRNLLIDFYVADMRQGGQVNQRHFDLILACDNAIPHLLSEEEILDVFREFYQATAEGGGCLISVRDYELLECENKEPRVVPRRVHPTNKGKIILFDTWEFEGDYYEITTYVVEELGENDLQTTAARGGKYYCVTIPVLEHLFVQAGFQKVTTLREKFFQPLIVAEK